MSMPEKIREFQFFKPTHDNWHPSFEGGLMKCRGFVMGNENHKAYYAKIVLSGDDDYCLEKEYYGTRSDCLYFYTFWHRKLSKLDLVSQKEAKEVFEFSHLST